ncbi:MBL fold metallo-hydrolase [Nocardia uniformis]|uniref:Linear primary-alkylsulfatase n=1 Tax=Nocardia uniformis TaxID=53432 RepID=A0A849C5S4_9NOCA|nr:alkyl sulfatase dimerization domain-containing protein [Nocardia uniformis]NNH71177.1 MBL fold metallo-hydrolase [Nocardia uniformis]
MSAATDPSDFIIDQQQRIAAELPLADTTDQEDADRGFIAALEPGVVRDAEGKVLWDSDSYDFLQGTCPASVNPSLWRQAGLVARQGLYEVVAGIYQVRGLDLSNMTLIEGKTGVIVIDPLISAETAAAGLALYRAHRGDKPVTGLIFTHSHVDHFGGARGVASAEDAEAGRLPVVAPAGFLEHAVAENVYAGTAMARRSAYMYGAVLPRGPQGQVGAGLGQTNSVGTITLIAPTHDITHTGQEMTIDGVRIVFQITPGTEAPAEMNFYFPDFRALCMAENATHTLHNLLTLRGALVRDPHVWSQYLTEAINLYARDSDVVFASHHWPTWDTERLVEYLSLQRDLYAYLNDQTLRKLNQGLVGSEIAEDFELPPAVENSWHARGYYGSVSHNVKAVYQRYMGWFDGNPAHLWEHPPVESAKRHVEFMGGADQVLRKARAAYDDGDYRWVAQVVNYVIFADPSNEAAKTLQASTFDQLGYGAENGPWRNFYLMGAYELRNGNVGTPTPASSPTMLAALTVEQVFDAMSLRLDGPKAWHEKAISDWIFTDENRTRRLELRNGVLLHYDRRDGDTLPPAEVTFTLTRATLIGVLLDGQDLGAAVQSGAVTIDGDVASFAKLVTLFDEPDPDFAIVTP